MPRHNLPPQIPVSKDLRNGMLKQELRTKAQDLDCRGLAENFHDETTEGVDSRNIEGISRRRQESSLVEEVYF